MLRNLGITRRRKLLLWLAMARKEEPAFFWMSGKEKKPSRTQALKIQLLRGAVSSINRADTEQTALPGVGVEP